jgi:hypothetical protein
VLADALPLRYTSKEHLQGLGFDPQHCERKKEGREGGRRGREGGRKGRRREGRREERKE